MTVPVAPPAPAQPTYPVKCPKCGGTVSPVALDAQTAPWLCSRCARGWFSCELAVAHLLFRQQYGDFGFGPPAEDLRKQAHQERVDAAVRGTSLREDQLGLTPEDVLKGVATRGHLSPDFAKVVHAHLASRGAQ